MTPRKELHILALKQAANEWYGYSYNTQTISDFENWFIYEPYDYVPILLNSYHSVWDEITPQTNQVVRQIAGYEEVDVGSNYQFFDFFLQHPDVEQQVGNTVVQIINTNVNTSLGQSNSLFHSFETWDDFEMWRYGSYCLDSFNTKIEQIYAELLETDQELLDLKYELEQVRNLIQELINKISGGLFQEYLDKLEEIEQKTYTVKLPDPHSLNKLWDKNEGGGRRDYIMPESYLMHHRYAIIPDNISSFVPHQTGIGIDKYAEYPIQDIKNLTNTHYLQFAKEVYQTQYGSETSSSQDETSMKCQIDGQFDYYTNKQNFINQCWNRVIQKSSYDGINKEDYIGQFEDFSQYEFDETYDVVETAPILPALTPRWNSRSLVTCDIDGSYEAALITLDSKDATEYVGRVEEYQTLGSLVLSGADFEMPPPPKLDWSKGNENEVVHIHPHTLAECIFNLY